jgi:hypothetical protein
LGLPRLLQQSICAQPDGPRGCNAPVYRLTLFNLPTPQQQAALKAALPDRLFPRLHTRAPVLIECWEQDGDQQVHLVNYASHPQTIRIDFDTALPRRMISPDAADLVLPESTSVRLDLEIYSVITTQQFDNPF